MDRLYRALIEELLEELDSNVYQPATMNGDPIVAKYWLRQLVKYRTIYAALEEDHNGQ